MFPIRDTIPSRTVPIATWGLIGLNSVIFMFELMLDPDDLERFIYLYSIVPVRCSHPEWAVLVGIPIDNFWPFITSMFLHGGWLHIIGNMWMLWIFGDNVEDRMGSLRFLLFYLFTGLAAGLTHWLTNMDSTVPTVGASGAISGVLGAYFVLFPHSRIISMFPVFFMPVFFELPAAIYLLFWFMIQIFSGTIAGLTAENVGGIAWWAHVGGFVAGIVFLRLFLPSRRRRSRTFESDECCLERAWTPRDW